MLDRSQNTRDAILDAAKALIAERSYGAVSMRDIASAVGIRQSAIYNHFPSKQAILGDLMMAHMERLLAAWAQVRQFHGTAADRLAAFARFHVTYHVDQTDAVFIAYMELRSLEERYFEAVNEMRRRYEYELRTILADGIDEGGFKVRDIAITARAIIAMLTGVTTWYSEGGRLTTGALADIYVEMTLMSVGLEAGAGRT
ncbi:TetR/AcrR family transcriptional regulator [Acuticoccus yangtzensis]|uniref:TetR/AcrR family transcriptional regulator n=1 Tax=Acuticoccus yangtzensis TaxID=1443441 RepID=UPI0009496FBB|nr:TetR/AcrR family transcriptional regulator [Acuticoccus yangtzensis]ORE95349.1 TetR family transcriptional regulator [Stappia sp. 22II-S9-Z10]